MANIRDISPALARELRWRIARAGRDLRRDDLRLTKTMDVVWVWRANDPGHRYRWRSVGSYDANGRWNYIPRALGKDKTKWERFLPSMLAELTHGYNAPLFD